MKGEKRDKGRKKNVRDRKERKKNEKGGNRA
jgi:hypothetical protein